MTATTCARASSSPNGNSRAFPCVWPWVPATCRTAPWKSPARRTWAPRHGQTRPVKAARRDTLAKITEPLEGLDERIIGLLDDIQKSIYQRAYDFRAENVRKVDTWDEFKEEIEKGGFLLCHWDGTAETEARIQEETKATIRCIPVDSFALEEEGKCVYSGKPSHQRVIFARSY